MTLIPRSFATCSRMVTYFGCVAVTLFATAAWAQREVPVVVENDVSSPVPVSFAASGPAGGQSVQYILCMDNIPGPGVGAAYPGCLEIRSLGVQVTRPPPSGSSGTPINIGVGSSEPILLEKLVDAASAVLWMFAVTGNSNGDAQIHVLEEREGWSGPLVTLEVELERTFVQSMTMQPTVFVEQVELRYVEIQLTAYTRDASGNVLFQTQHCWHLVNQTQNCSF